MSHHNLIWRSTSIALLFILTASNISARAIESSTPRSPTISKYIYRARSIDDLTTSASEKEVAGDYRGALADYNKAIDIDPKNPRIYYFRAALKHMYLGDYRGALSDLDRAVKLDRNFSNAYHNRAVLKQDKFKDYRGALADFNKAIELNSQNYDAYNYRGVLKYRYFTDNRGAIADFRQAAKLARNRGDMNGLEKSLRELENLGASE